jgi:hypothetical protein
MALGSYLGPGKLSIGLEVEMGGHTYTHTVWPLHTLSSAKSSFSTSQFTVFPLQRHLFKAIEGNNRSSL